MGNQERIDRVLSRLARQHSVETADSVESGELISFFKKAYSDQFNAADYRDNETIMDRWVWANFKNPKITPGQFPAWICKDGKTGGIIGHFAVIPTSIKFKDSCYPAVWGRDLVILPEFRKAGVGPFLISNVLNSTKDKAAAFLIAGLNDDVYTIYKKFGFTDLGLIPLYIRINRPENILKSKIPVGILARVLGVFARFFLNILYIPSRARGLKYKKNRKISITEIKRFDEAFDGLWEKASRHFSLIIKRDKDALNWRFVDQPYWKYKIFKAEDTSDGRVKGYLVLREGKTRGLKTGIISDLFAEPDDADTIDSLVNFSVTYFEKNGDIDLVRCNILHKKFSAALKRAGFINVPSASHFMFINVREGLDAEFASDRDNWFISYADSDLDLGA